MSAMVPSGPTSEERAARTAFANACGCVVPGRSLPQMVFAPGWGGFLVFDADVVFRRPFVDNVKQLIRREGSGVACIVNLLQCSPDCAFFINEGSRQEQYDERLSSGPAAGQWALLGSNFSCASDRGEWCVYADQVEELAIIAFRPDSDSARYRTEVSALGAVSVEEAIRRGAIYNLAPERLLPSFREPFLRAYGVRPVDPRGGCERCAEGRG